MPNDLIISNLTVLLEEAQTSREQKDKFRAIAYRKAIKLISGLDYELQSGKDAQKLKGIGKKIASKIQEIIDTGKLHQVFELGEDRVEKTKVLSLFQKIWGVGPVKALQLWDLGARSIKDVEDDYHYILNENQKLGLLYFEDFQKRISRQQVTEIARNINFVILQISREMGWKIRSRICGSYRRKTPTNGDMDILLLEESGHGILKEIVDRLSTTGMLIGNLGIGPTKYMGLTKTNSGIAFRVDMEVIKPEEWPFALLYFTGSGQFNENQRLIAKKSGYSLSEHGLRDVDTGEYVQGITSEREIFDFLGMTYLPPWDRT